MEMFNMMVNILTSVTSVILSLLACYAFVTLRNIQKRQKQLQISIHKLCAMQMAELLKSGIDALDSMRKRQQRAIEVEDFEEANRLAKVIEEQKNANGRMVTELRERYGDIIGVIFT